MSIDQFDRDLFSAAPIGLAYVGQDGRWLKVNPQLAEFLGYSADQLQRMRFHDVTHPDDLEEDVAQVERLLRQNQGSYNLPKRYIRGDGSIVTADLNVRLLHDEHGKSACFVSAIQDHSRLQQRIQALENAAHHDTLTKIANRAGFYQAAEAALKRYRKHGVGFGLFYIDLDGFKMVNDSHGHLVGDQLLQEVATRLTGLIGTKGTAARLGGDEFALLLGDVTSGARLHRVYGRLHNTLAAPIVINGRLISVSASVGFAHCPADARSLPELLGHADGEMYARKNAAFSLRNPLRAAR